MKCVSRFQASGRKNNRYGVAIWNENVYMAGANLESPIYREVQRAGARSWEPGIEFTPTNFFGIMSILIGFICLLLSGFLLAVPSPRKLPNRFLAAFLALTAIELSIWLWGSAVQNWDWLGALWYALGKLQMPAFFFFFLSTCYSDFRLKWYDTAHLTPFLLSLISNLPGLQSYGFLGDLFTVGTAASWLMSQLIYFGYMTAIVGLLWRFRLRFRLHHSGGRSEVLTWLTQLAAVSVFARVLIITRDVVSFTSSSNIVLILQMLSALLALGITTWIALKSLLQPQLFRDVDRRLLSLPTPTERAPNADLERLVAHVEAETPFLDPDLNLAALSDQMAMTPREVSELLNQSLGVHFFDFINRYRVKYAQALLLNDRKRSVTQILHESGFNSKSSFNTAFKKHTGMTPSAFRTQISS